MKKCDMVITLNICVSGNIIWLIHQKYNVILKYSIENKILEYYADIPSKDGGIPTEYGYCAIIESNNKLFLIPNQYEEILIMDLDTKDYVFKGLETNGYLYGNYRGVVSYKDKKILIPSQIKYLSYLDMDKECVKHLFNWKEIAKEYDENSYISDYSMENNKIAMLVKPYNDIIIYSLEDNNAELIRRKDNNSFETLALLNGGLYVNDSNQGLCVVNEKECKPLGKSFKSTVYLYNFGEFLMVDFLTQNRMHILDSGLNERSEYSGDIESVEEYVYFVTTNDMTYGKYRLYLNNATSELFFFEDERIVKKEKLDCSKIRKKMIRKYMKEFLNISLKPKECEYIRLNDFLNYIVE